MARLSHWPSSSPAAWHGGFSPLDLGASGGSTSLPLLTPPPAPECWGVESSWGGGVFLPFPQLVKEMLRLAALPQEASVSVRDLPLGHKGCD